MKRSEFFKLFNVSSSKFTPEQMAYLTRLHREQPKVFTAAYVRKLNDNLKLDKYGAVYPGQVTKFTTKNLSTTKLAAYFAWITMNSKLYVLPKSKADKIVENDIKKVVKKLSK